MFRDIYKEAHKEITPDNELLQKVIAMADEESSIKIAKPKKLKLYTYTSIAAAALLITVSAVIYTNLSPKQTDNISVQNTIVENIQPKQNESYESQAKDNTANQELDSKNGQKLSEEISLTEDSNKANDSFPKKIASKKNTEESLDKKAQSSQSTPKNQDEKEPAVSAEVISSEHTKSEPIPDFSSTDEKKNVSEKEMHKIQNKTPDISEHEIRVMLNINHITPENNISARTSVPLAASVDDITESLYETWSEEDYKTYIGIDIKNEISVPDDMVLFKNEDFTIEKNPDTKEIINDENSYYYEKDYQRFIILTTSKNTDEHKNFLDETKYQITKINETDATVIYDGNLYNVYLIKDETGIKITAGGINEEELKKTITSITERN